MRDPYKALWEYFKENMGIFIFVSSFFMGGIVCGALLVRFLESGQLTELDLSTSLFLERLKDEADDLLKPFTLLKNSYRQNILFLLLTWLLGLFWLGFPLILFLLALQGLSIGFTVGFLVYLYSFKGILFALAAVLPHNLLLVPAYIAAAVLATTFSLLLFRNRRKRNGLDFSRYFPQYCLLMLITLLFILLSGLVEAYITPVFIRLVVSLV